MQKFRLLLNNTINKVCNSRYFNLILLVIFIIAIVLRIVKITNISSDIRVCIEPWFSRINEHGFAVSFSHPTWNYAFFYTYILYLKNLFFDDFNVVVIKIISISFDFLMAFYSYRILRFFIEKKQAILFIAIFLCIPTQWMNSSLWGQIDGMMHAFFTMSFYYLLKYKYAKAIFFFALTTIIKTTFVFFLPFLGIYWLVNRFPLRYFLIIPVVYLVAAIPSLLVGLPLDQIFYSFTKQTSYDNNPDKLISLSKNILNIHSLVGLIDPSLFKLWKNGSILCTFILLAFITLVIWKKRDFILQKNTKEKAIFWLLTLAILLYIVPLLLPYMCDRYYYFTTMTTFLYMVLSINCLPKRFFTAWLPFIALEISSIMVYFKAIKLTYLEIFGPWQYIMDAQVKYFIVPLLIIGLLILYGDFSCLIKNNENLKKE